MIHTMRLDNGSYQKIASGEKSIELRVYDDKRRTLQIGHKIIFENRTSGTTLERHVAQLNIYPDFIALLDRTNINEIGYGAEGRAQLEQDLAHYYHDDEIARWGVVAITLI